MFVRVFGVRGWGDLILLEIGFVLHYLVLGFWGFGVGGRG